MAEEEDLSEHPNVVSSSIMLQVSRDGTAKSMLLVETDLDLDTQSPDHDKKAVAELLAAVKASLAADSSIDSASIMAAVSEPEEEEDEDHRQPAKSKQRRDDDEEEDEDDRPKGRKGKKAVEEDDEEDDDDDDKPKGKKGKDDEEEEDEDDDDRKPAKPKRR